jgi:ABC-type protease/lipase transport system fused ATPase/permease subunit
MSMRVHRLVTYMQAEEAYTVVEFLDQIRAVLIQTYGKEITRMLQQTQARASHDDEWLKHHEGPFNQEEPF